MNREAIAWSLVAVLAASAGSLAGLIINRVIDHWIEIDGRVKTMEIIHAEEINKHRAYMRSLDHPGPRDGSR